MGPGATRRAAEAAVNAVFDTLLRATQQQSVHLTRFGSFEYSLYRERSAYDLNAERLGTIPATRRITFTPSDNFRRSLAKRIITSRTEKQG